MKTDKLEKFILNNRESFDAQEPSPEVWARIKTPEPEQKTISLNWKTITMRVAAVVVIFVSSYYFHDFMNQRESDGVAEIQFERDPLYKELIEAELYYSSEINYKKKEFFILTSNSPSLQNNINQELETLDAIFRDLKDDLNDNADNQEVIGAMIQNYRIKLEILNDILNQIKLTQEKSNDNEEIHNTI